MLYLLFLSTFLPSTAFFTTIFEFNLNGPGLVFWPIAVFVFLVEFIHAIEVLYLDRKHKIVRDHGQLALINSLIFLIPLAAAVKSIFCTTFDPETGEWNHYFDAMFLFLTYPLTCFFFIGFAKSFYFRPLLLANFENYPEVVAKEGRVFLEYWNWGTPRKRPPSINDYGIGGWTVWFHLIEIFDYPPW